MFDERTRPAVLTYATRSFGVPSLGPPAVRRAGSGKTAPQFNQIGLTSTEVFMTTLDTAPLAALLHQLFIDADATSALLRQQLDALPAERRK